MDFPFETKWSDKENMKMLGLCEKNLKNCKKVLDVGCGRGESVYYLNKKGIKTTGLEIKPFETWLQFPDNEFKIYNGMTFKFNEKYDGVLLNNVVEHISNKDNFFLNLGDVCSNNCKIVIILPTMQWKIHNLIRLPKHIYSFLNGRSLGLAYWFVHEPEIYGINYFAECKDFMNWEKIIGQYINIEKKQFCRKGKNVIFSGSLKQVK